MGPKIGYKLPMVSIVVPFFGLTFGLTKSILRIRKGNPQKGTTMETIGITIVNPRITPLITTHEAPSRFGVIRV